MPVPRIAYKKGRTVNGTKSIVGTWGLLFKRVKGPGEQFFYDIAVKYGVDRVKYALRKAHKHGVHTTVFSQNRLEQRRKVRSAILAHAMTTLRTLQEKDNLHSVQQPATNAQP